MIYRIYTNMHGADILAMNTSRHVLPHHRPMSDHSPKALLLTNRSRTPKLFRSDPVWIFSYAEFENDAVEEFQHLVLRHRVGCDEDPSPLQRLSAWKCAARKAAAYIRSVCSSEVAKSTAHRLATTLEFIKAIKSNDLDRAKNFRASIPV